MRKGSLFLLCLILLSSCLSFLEKFGAADYFYYPIVINDFGKPIIVEIHFLNEERFTHYTLEPKIKAWKRQGGLEIEFIKLYDTDNNLIAEYDQAYLNAERKRIVCTDELWVAFVGGLVLVPEKYHNGDDWQKYVESLKEN